MARRRVPTLLDLNDFTTLIYYNIGYNLFTLRQSSRRSWRINQTAPRIEVYFFCYKGTIQERALSLMASKLAAAGLIEGQVTDEGLAAMSDCRDLTSQLAKELALGIREEVEDLSATFKRMAVLKTDEEKAAFAARHRATVQASSKPIVPHRDIVDWKMNLFVQTALSPQSDAPTRSLPAAPITADHFTGSEQEPAAQNRPTSVVQFVFAGPARGKSKKTQSQVENQLSLFDLPA